MSTHAKDKVKRYIKSCSAKNFGDVFGTAVGRLRSIGKDAKVEKICGKPLTRIKAVREGKDIIVCIKKPDHDGDC